MHNRVGRTKKSSPFRFNHAWLMLSPINPARSSRNMMRGRFFVTWEMIFQATAYSERQSTPALSLVAARCPLGMHAGSDGLLGS